MQMSEYRRSLKMAEAEEWLDLLIYRPLAYGVVRFIRDFPITPNQVTMLSLAAGFAAAVSFSSGSDVMLTWAALFYFIANILDCADGQLARLQGSGTLLGRVIDGFADYVSSIAVFIGIGVGLASSTGSGDWILVVVAGASSAVHAFFFDHYQGEFTSSVGGEQNFLKREISQFRQEVDRAQRKEGYLLRFIILKVYLSYLSFQSRIGGGTEPSVPDPALYRRNNLIIIRLWSFLGPTTNRTLLMLCSLAGALDWYLWSVVTAGNCWLVICYLLQRRMDRRVEHPSALSSKDRVRKVHGHYDRPI